MLFPFVVFVWLDTRRDHISSDTEVTQNLGLSVIGSGIGGATIAAGILSTLLVPLIGHTRGHCVLHVEPEDVVYLGDIDLSSFGPYYGDAWSSLEDFERTEDLRLCRWCNFKAVCRPELATSGGGATEGAASVAGGGGAEF